MLSILIHFTPAIRRETLLEMRDHMLMVIRRRHCGVFVLPFGLKLLTELRSAEVIEEAMVVVRSTMLLHTKVLHRLPEQCGTPHEA